MSPADNRFIASTRHAQPEIRWRVIWLAVAIIPFNNYWVYAMLRWAQGLPTTMSLFFNVIFIFAILLALNYGVSLYSPRLALTQGELLTFYAMLSVATAIAGADFFAVIITHIAVGGWMATEENEWATLFHRYFPDWLALTDKNSLRTYFVGESTLYLDEHLRLWWKPVLSWSGFIIVLVCTAFCINVVMRKQWIEIERLSYPIIELPQQMTAKGFFRNRLMWTGAILAGGMDIVNALHFLYPSIPGLGGDFFDLQPYFTTKPWNAIGWTPVTLFPFAVGMAYFMPLDLSFTFWFFYIFWKFELIMGSILGFQQIPNFPYIFEQSFGVCVGVLILVFWSARHHIQNVLIGAWRGDKASESNEPISYRTAVLGIIIGFLLLIGFWVVAGMSLWVAILVFIIHFITVTVTARIRAELGPPLHDLRRMGPDVLIPQMFGMRRVGPRNLSLFALVFPFNRAYRGNAMPPQLEALKLAERAGISTRRVGFAILITVVISPLPLFWGGLQLGYESGAVAFWGGGVFRRTQSWLTNPMPVDILGILAMLFGTLFTFALTALRHRFVWWPLYPVGYGITGTWAVNFFWSSVLVAWVIKLSILRFGGIRTFRRLAPFFLGMLFGEFLLGGVWALIGVIVQRPMYRFIW